MAMFKCKMCGGSLEIQDGVTVCECEFCGSKQTIPSNTDENIRALYNRANVLRMKAEFDKAEDLYEKILQLNSTEAEAYWGLILCKYGVEYVEDPKTMRRVPTCHRTSYDAITADDDYKNAIYYASIEQKIVYENEAKTIDEIQKGILLISQKEDPYDVFICYKEADENGKRTKDSVIANDIYYQLTQQGFKVFYAAITLEDKLGSEYEPYIFSALNSAKVMLVLGTKPEYFNAVWVKNEWSRFLRLMKKDRSKLLIPCYRDMDAYELPEEFAHLQAQDMSKIGFINDIVRGIKKVIVKDEQKTVVKETVIVNDNAAAGVTPLLKRTAMFLEDKDWDRAHELCDQVLNADPENAQAYVYELMANLQVSSQASLADCPISFEKNKNYQKAIRFASPEMKAELQGYVAAIKERNETDRKNGIYSDAMEKLSNSTTEQAYRDAAKLFQGISGWKDADEKQKEALKKAETVRRRNLYDDAVNLAAKGDSDSISEALDMLRSISDSQLAEKKIEELLVLRDKAKAKEEATKKERLRLEELQRQYDKEFSEYRDLLKDSYMLDVRKSEAKTELESIKYPPILFISIAFLLLGIVLLLLDARIFGIIEIICSIVLLVIGIPICSGISSRKKNLKKQIDDYQNKIDIIKDIPSFEEYVKAHEEKAGI